MTITGEIQRCDKCGHIIGEREICLYSGMVHALWQVFKWCEKNETVHFSRRQVKHLFHSENETARFGDWEMFGGLISKSGKGEYILNKSICNDFFAGKYLIPTRAYKDAVTKTIRFEDFQSVRNVPRLSKLLDEDNDYIVRYMKPNYQSSLI